MDFFAHQEVARRNTGKLIALFALAVVGMIAAVYTLLVAVLHLAGEGQVGGWWQPDLLLLAAGGTVLVVALGSGYRMLQLRSGGRAVAEMMGARPVQPNTREPRERMLVNVVE
jgi:hypothetical protein